jgi:hypothetical protein
MNSAITYVESRPLQSLGALWATCIGGIVYQQRNMNLKFSQRLIHGRLYAQALIISTILGCGAIKAAREMYPGDEPHKQDWRSSQGRGGLKEGAP